jgi:gluconate 2-dehydrogenase gamma chain
MMLVDTQRLMRLDRRALLRNAALLVGGSAVGFPVKAFAQALAAGPKFFSPVQYSTLEEVCRAIIPKTDTPGAVEAGVPASIDAMMVAWAAPETQAQFRSVMADIGAYVRSASGSALKDSPPERRIDLVRRYDAEAMGGNAAYRRFKELLLLAYYSSEAGATQELRYELIPGSWDASIPLKPGQPAWAV